MFINIFKQKKKEASKNTSENRSIIFKKVSLWLDLNEKDGDFAHSQKLNSFFGQTGVYENTEILNETNEFYLKSFNLDYFYFYEENPDYDQNFMFYLENEYDDFIYDENLSSFFVPLNMVFYSNDRKLDYYVSFVFRKRFLFKKIAYLFFENNFKKSIFLNWNFIKNFYFLKLKHMNWSSFKNIGLGGENKRKNFEFLYLNYNFKDKIDLLLEDFWEIYWDKKKRKKKRKKARRRRKIKIKKKLIKILKKTQWLSSLYKFTMSDFKFLFLDKNYNQKDFLNNLNHVSYQFNNIKKKYFRRYRRKRKFKKKLFTNFYGNKFKLHKVLNVIEEKKKKKKR